MNDRIGWFKDFFKSYCLCVKPECQNHAETKLVKQVLFVALAHWV